MKNLAQAVRDLDGDEKRRSMALRLKLARKAARMAISQVEICLGWRSPRLERWEELPPVLCPHDLKRLAGLYGVRLEWLATGRGEMREKR